MNIKIEINQQLDQCGDEYLDERNFDMSIDGGRGGDYLEFSFEDLQNCYIKKSDVLMLATIIGEEK